MRPLTAWLAADAVEAMINEAIRMDPYETGGMLVGWANEERAELTIVNVIGPGPDAQHHETSFVPDAGWQQDELDRLYQATDRKVTYLGDWHVHPGGGFGMSRRDRKTMRTIARERDARCPHPLMGLVAPGQDGEHLVGVWIWRPGPWPRRTGTADPVPVREWTPDPTERFWDPPAPEAPRG